MPESSTHARLVQTIVSFAVSELGPLTAIAVRDDAVSPVRGERPPQIGGFTPDVYATNVPTTSTLVGEAKTRTDLENDHTRRQITAFLEHLALTPRGVFVLAVPFAAGATARRMVAQLREPWTEYDVRIFVLDGAEVAGEGCAKGS